MEATSHCHGAFNGVASASTRELRSVKRRDPLKPIWNDYALAIFCAAFNHRRHLKSAYDNK